MRRDSSIIVEGSAIVDIEGSWSGKWKGSEKCLTFSDEKLTITSQSDEEEILLYKIEDSSIHITGYPQYSISALPDSSICLTPETGDSVLLVPSDDVGGDAIDLSLVGTALPTQSKHLT